MAKVTTETQRQGARVRALRESRRLSKPMLAARLGFESTQSLELYERGISVIRLDQVRLWAEALEMSLQDFTAAIFEDPDAPSWSLESDLRAAGIPEWAVQRAVQAAHGEPQLIQRWIAEKLREMHASGEIPCEPPAVNAPSPLAFLRHA